MATLGNTQSNGQHAFRLDARKSFSFGIRIKDTAGGVADITGCTLEMVMKAQPFDGTDSADADNLITNSTATLVDPTNGYGRFDLQGSDLATAGNFPYAIVLTTAAGYSAVIVTGEAQIIDNPEYISSSTTYTPTDPTQIIDVVLRGMTTVSVTIGTPVPAGMNYMSDAQVAMLDTLNDWVLTPGPLGTAAFMSADVFAPADAVIPPGGFIGRVLGKLTGTDYDVGWLNMPSTTGAGLDATGIPIDYVPVALGTGLWEWQAYSPVSTADDLTDGTTNVMMLATERTKLTGIAAGAQVNVKPDWNATPGDPDEILNKPDVSASGHTHALLDLSNVTMGTAAPSGGVAGDFYLRKKM